MKVCSVCGRPVKETVRCPYQHYGLETCMDCCEACYKNDPFPCWDHDQRKRSVPGRRKELRKTVSELYGGHKAKKNSVA